MLRAEVFLKSCLCGAGNAVCPSLLMQYLYIQYSSTPSSQTENSTSTGTGSMYYKCSSIVRAIASNSKQPASQPSNLSLARLTFYKSHSSASLYVTMDSILWTCDEKVLDVG